MANDRSALAGHGPVFPDGLFDPMYFFTYRVSTKKDDINTGNKKDQPFYQQGKQPQQPTREE
jgi:hypothetical protein